MAALTWLDYSEQERRQAMEVIDLFREEDTRDELGLGTIRDAFADLLFPGTSTIQTRARYFLFIPWVYADIERRRLGGNEAAHRARLLQGRLRDGLIAGGESVGVIGFRAGLHVQRLPSSVYWNGLRQWGVLRFSGSEEDYHRCLARQGTRRAERARPDAGESPDAPTANWDPHLPAPPDDFPSQVEFGLRCGEAEYLIHRVASRAPRSLLAHLLLARRTIQHEEFPWDLPPSELSAELATQLLHARNFSEMLHGAALLYNLILAELRPDLALVDTYREQLADWWDVIGLRRPALAAWDRRAFWTLVRAQSARVPQPTRDFVDAWLTRTLATETLGGLIDDRSCRQLVIAREQWLKRGRARVGNLRALENWNGSSGTAQIDYRWKKPVREIVHDILAPPANGEPRDA